MERKELDKKKKEDLIFIILGMQEDIKRKDNTIYDLEKQGVKSKFEDYMYGEYVYLKESLESEREKSKLNDLRIQDLNELLERYKNIVDKLGGSKYLD